MSIKTPFNNPKPVIFAILAVILLFIAFKAKATEIEVGPTFTGEFNGGIGIVLTERVFKDRFDIGLALIGDQEWDGKVTSNNGNVFGNFVAVKDQEDWDGGWKSAVPDEIAIGAAYWIKTDDRLIGSNLGYTLGLKWYIGDHATVGIRHWSNAGTVRPNRGQDLLTFGWRFD